MAPPTADFVSASTQDHPHQLKNVDAHLPKPSSASAVTTSTRLPSAAESNQIAESWLKSFEASVASQQIDAVLELFHENAYWKDLLTLEWQHHTKHGKEVIKKWLLQGNKLWKRKLTNVKLENGSAASLEAAPGVPWVVAFFNFETSIARGRGCVRLQPAEGQADQWKAYLFYMGIEELQGHEEPTGHRRPLGVEHGEHVDRQSWLSNRKTHLEYLDGHEPDVVVVGAGQAGLTAAARLTQLSVDTLIVEKLDRVGASWRNRYDFLVLHDPVWYDHLPYQPFPPHWPVFTPKDRLADWLESYAQNLELNVWCHTAIKSAEYDDARGQWTLRVDRNGTERILKPKYVVVATGHSGEPNRPEFRGAETFQGRIHHSSEPLHKEDFAGKKVVVIGSNNSGHDLAHFAYESGGKVTMVQRSTTYIMSSESVVKILFEKIYCEDGPPVEDCDLLFNSTPNHVHFEQMTDVTRRCAQFDKETLDGLQKAGFKLQWGPNNAGFLPLYFSRGGGYYLDVGASKLIIDKKINLKQGQDISHLEPNAVVFADGERIEADIVICATGYRNMKTTAIKILGETAERANEVWGLNDEGEIKTMWQESGHPGLFLHGGNLALCRWYSKRLALQIKARLTGLVDQ